MPPTQIGRRVNMLMARVRVKIMVKLRNFANSLEEPDDTLHRIGYLHLQTAATRIGFQLDLFRTIVNAGRPLTVHNLSTTTDVDEIFLGRLMNYLGAVGVVNETGHDEYQANKVTKNLTEKMAEAGISHCFETIGPQYQALPAYMKKNDYKSPNDPEHTVFQYAWKVSQHQFAWFADHPENLELFNDFMAFRRKPTDTWLSVYPVEAMTRDWPSSKPVYVNMGGGIGHQCAQFKEKYPDIQGRVILQDLHHSVEKALPTPGVENMAHNFFDPQPVLGARLYFLRGVLHNHPDEKVRVILSNIRSAMSEESILLLDEIVLPETGVSDYGAALDLTMMAAFASIERTESQWHALLSSVGLKMNRKFAYNPLVYETVMEVERK